MTEETRLTRRGVLAVAGAAAAAGCSGLGNVFGGRVELDASALAEVASGPVPAVTEPLPVDVPSDHIAVSRASAESDLASVPLPLSAGELPNGVMRETLANEVEHARALLESASEVGGVRERLARLRHAREHTRYVAAAWAFTEDEVTVDDVRDRAATVRDDLEAFREGRTYAGSDPVRATLVHAAVESWTGAARRYAALDERTFDRVADTALGVGERAGAIEHGRAYLEDATHVDARYRASLSESPSIRETLTDARASLTGTVESRMAELPGPDIDEPGEFADVDRDLEGTPALVALDDLHFRFPRRLDADEAVAEDVVERLRGLAYVEAFATLQERVEDGAEFGVESVAEVRERREVAVSAVETALEESPDRRLVRRVLADATWRLSDADEGLRGYEDAVEARYLEREIGDYLTLTMLARGVHPACRATLDALGVDE